MKLFAWLRALLHRPAPAATFTYPPPTAPQRAGRSTGPLVPIRPLTPAQREARAQAREPHILAAISTSQQQAQASDLPDAIKQLPAEQFRLNIEQQYLRADVAEAQGMGWIEDELHLHLQIQGAAAELKLRAWQHALIERFGPEVGTKLSQHQIEVGMSWEHLVFSYGPPPTGAITLLGKEPTHLAVQYGSEATGSYFEVVADVVTVARLGVPTVPTHLLEVCA